MQITIRKVAPIFGIMLVMLVAGCTVGPDYERPQLEVPSQWTPQEQSQANASTQVLQQWWRVLNDPILDRLIEAAALGNLDIASAFFRIEESRALRDFATGKYYPNVNVGSSYTRSLYSKNGLYSSSGFSSKPIGIYSNGFDASWEADLFGGIRRSVQSSQATLEASVENWRSVQVSLCAEVASNYVELRTVQMRIEFALKNTESQRETLKLTEDRFKLGIAPELDVAQAKLNLANTESSIPSLRLRAAQAINRLAVLVGQYPQDFEIDLTDAQPIPAVTEQVPLGIPADLLRRRPDVRRAERQLAAQTAQIGVAAADLYPSFSLSGSFNLMGQTFSDATKLSSKSYSYGPGLRWSIFDGNRIRDNIKVQKARTQQALVSYESTVLNAVEEVENALVAYAQDTLTRNSLQQSVGAAEKSVRLVQTAYTTGLTDFQNVLDMQRTLFTQQDRLVMSEGQVILDLVSVYKALGGGWAAETDALDVEAPRQGGAEDSSSN